MKCIGKIILMACLIAGWSYSASWADDPKKPPRPPKKVFTNEDLDGLHGEDPAPEAKDESSLQSSPDKGADKTKGPAPPSAKSPKTKEQQIQEIQSAQTNLKNVKLNEVRAIQSMAVYQKKAQEAQDQFHKETAEEQTRDMQVHVTRLGEERKKLESELEKMNKAAREAGIKEEELREKEAPPSNMPETTEAAQPPAEPPPAPQEAPQP